MEFRLRSDTDSVLGQYLIGYDFGKLFNTTQFLHLQNANDEEKRHCLLRICYMLSTWLNF